MEPRDVDIGHGHFMRYFSWAPDDLPANRERYGVPLPNIAKAGVLVTHPRKDGQPGECLASIHFDLPEVRRHLPAMSYWTVESWEPLTVSPSLLCTACGDHGFIRGGRWEPA